MQASDARPLISRRPADEVPPLNECKRLFYIRGCQEHFSPSAGGADLVRGIQPLSAMRGAWLGCRAPRTWLPGLFHFCRFIFWSRRRHSVSETWQALRLYGVNHGSICDSWPIAFSGCPRGHRVYTEAGAIGTVRLQAFGILTLEPERLKNRWTTTRKIDRRWKGLFTGDAQAACGFSFSASKSSPFFHRVSVMAAILRASVRRAIVGFIPFVSEAW